VRGAPSPSPLRADFVGVILTRAQIAPLFLTALLLLGLFSPAIYDSDFWWHLCTGQYLAETHRLPVPDPFAWTTRLARDTYPGESRTRQFNLTHEWLAQLAIYGVWHVAGPAGVVAVRAVSLTTFCALIGLAAWRRRAGVYAALLAALAAAAVVAKFALDRPYQVTYLFLAATLVLIEYRRLIWLLPPMFLIWANSHSGYFLGWVILGAYCAESLVRRERAIRLWLVSAACIAVSAVNPNGFAVFRTLLDYRSSFLQSKLNEWAPPNLWPPSAFSVLLAAAAAIMLWRWRKVRTADWLIFVAFAAASLSAERNVFLMAAIAPPIIAAYLPGWGPATGTGGRYRALVPLAASVLLAGGLAFGIGRGAFFQFRTSEWRFPAGAADFLLQHRVTAPMFNTYEFGGYLIWRLWPAERVFIDGRALSESVFLDYARILYNRDTSDGGPAGEDLLDRYGVQAIVMNTFESFGGTLYVLAPSLADPNQSKWKLVYQEPQSLVFMRTPPPGVTPIDSIEVFRHMETECDLHIAHEPQLPRCARSLGQMFARVGEFQRARKWVEVYLSHPHPPDPEAEDALRRLIQAGG